MHSRSKKVVYDQEKLNECLAKLKNLKALREKEKQEFSHLEKMHEEAIMAERSKTKSFWKMIEDDRRDFRDRINDLEKRLAELEFDLKEKDEELIAKDELNQVLLTKERYTNDELQEVRKELIKCLEDTSTGAIGIKRMGEIDDEAFSQAVRKTLGRQTDKKVAEFSSIFQGRLSDPNWHPFQTKPIPGTDDHQVVVDMDDANLQFLTSISGERGCEIVLAALKELNEYNSSGRFPVPELWNYKENRKATLAEGVAFLHSQGRQLKRKNPAN